jgi:hypothetical protein
VVAPDALSEVDVLAQDGRPPLLSVPPPVRRLLLSLLVLAVVAGWLVDQRLRDHEAAALDSCATAAADAVGGALGPVGAMTGYVRPALEGSPPGGLRRDLYAMVSATADGDDPTLRAALGACRDTAVLPVHGDLRERRASCEDLVRQTLDFLDRVARDGREAFRSSPRTGRSADLCAG